MAHEKVTFTPYPADLPILESLIRNEPGTTVAILVREIVGNWCSERRREKRLTMPAHHYTSRGDDYADTE
jgi:hypothetical protein